MRNRLLYSQTWDDFNIIEKALKLKKKQTIFSIAGSGDNIFNMLLYSPKKIYAVDYNPAQIMLCMHKIDAFKSMSYREFIDFLGVNNSNGLINSGENEKSLRLFRKIINLIYGRRRVRKLLSYNDLKIQKSKFDEISASLKWKIAVKMLMNRPFLRAIGLYHRKYGQVGFFLPAGLSGNIKNLFYTVPMGRNYYMSQLLTGRFSSEERMPPYLMQNNFSHIRSMAGRIYLVNSSLNKALMGIDSDSVDCFNFSDALEWLDKEDYIGIFEQMLRCGKNGSRAILLDCLLDTRIPEKFKDNFIFERRLSEELLRKSMVPFYKNVKVYRISK